MCGIAGCVGPRDAVSVTFSLLIELQHRGQEANGLAVVFSNGSISVAYGKGLISDMLNDKPHGDIPQGSDLFGGIGHVRYSTTGEYLNAQPQPVVVGGNGFKIAVAFNGTIANYLSLSREFNLRNAGGDSIVLAETIYRLAKEMGNDVVEALKVLPNYVVGGYSLAVLTSEPRIIISRDPYGFRPLAFAYTGDEFVFSSETAALDCLSLSPWREVLPGEIISFDGSSLSSTQTTVSTPVSPCVFEYVYFSRPDSVFNGVNVYTARVKMGEELALNAPANCDVVIPVPDSGRVAGIGFSRASGIPMEEGIYANKYAGRGFIAPPTIRDMVSRLKYGFVRSVINEKRIVLVDDSIVRGTTMRSIVRRLREAGAKEVHVRVASPPFRYPCFMGIDIASREELLAWRAADLTDIAKSLEANSVGYNTVEGLRRAVGITSICCACFTGFYPFKGLGVEDLEKIFSR
ncbi:MAG: amidophosphoribosyltransferase [Ignisphaera sp.]|uniref:Amidophosphoribosyltransferase n=1 Tax=Ignisphaera aggregans TaxID=334771 RepID=A0A7C4NQ40_9CREN